MITFLPLNSIQVIDRQRKHFDLAAIEELATSITKLGLLQAPVVEKINGGEYRLLAGERRLRAISFLHSLGEDYSFGGMKIPKGEVPCLVLSENAPVKAFEIELEENIIRRDLSWQERHAAIAQLHALRATHSSSPREALVSTAATLQRVDSSEVKNLGEIHQAVLLGNNLSDPDIAGAKSAREALKILERKLRKDEDATRPISTSESNLLLGDALAILPTLPPHSFDLILSDPPYGVGIEQFSTQNSSEQEYDDSYEQWLPLMREVVCQNLPRLLKAEAHGYLFCAFERFSELASLCGRAGFEVYGRPLIWDRSPDGRLPVPEKWPRRCYECILYFRRGARPLFEVRGDVLSYPADRDPSNYHGAKKPVELLRDLLERSTRPGDRVLDPFGGSGATFRAAREISRDCVVIEKDPSYYGLMQRLLEK